VKLISDPIADRKATLTLTHSWFEFLLPPEVKSTFCTKIVPGSFQSPKLTTPPPRMAGSPLR